VHWQHDANVYSYYLELLSDVILSVHHEIGYCLSLLSDLHYGCAVHTTAYSICGYILSAVRCNFFCIKPGFTSDT
jgi:hypothetical protein